MAHSDIQTTITHYAHLRSDHTREAVEAFAIATPMLDGGTADRSHKTLTVIHGTSEEVVLHG
ncbi:hypothetical protein KG088_15010 [Halomonas sp. TRM85114]|uniref:hypothetical protein n=1 Tax=Halomonas jincaotanensis TaxID=2810616 RepID=UPI001BD4BD07|nr:hypothetical protein [Halomonas jincaotanensis]MBS9404936.1 hypothetical protein [Halomonas jincaotanensis]